MKAHRGRDKKNSPAEKAGLKTQDVILDFNGQKVDGPSDLAGVVERLDVGKTYPMTIIRDGKRTSIPVTVLEMPSTTRSSRRKTPSRGIRRTTPIPRRCRSTTWASRSAS